ncbi:MAG TPA: BON domain-containing protein, partial [Chroococcales cyanobacterium]
KADKILAEDAWLEAEGIKTEAFDGTLSLSGTVKSIQERARAERALWGLPGLLDIRNDLIVIPRVVKSDLAIAEEIRKELEEEGISLERIQLNVKDRVAVLTGTVPSLALKAHIGQLAGRSRSAREVINKLATFEALT